MGGQRGGGPLSHRTRLEIILGPRVCPTCMEPKRSALHRELCEVGA